MSAIIAAGVVPAAIEMMDALAIEAAEAAVHCDYPAGRRRGADRRAGRAGSRGRAPSSPRSRRLCEQAGAFEIRVAADAAERALIWKGRKSAFAAVGRISPDYIVQDGVIPRTALPEVLRRDRRAVGRRAGVRVANVFHAGDGNLHPLVLFDDADRRRGRARPRRSPARSSTCASSTAARSPASTAWASDKAEYMPRMFTDDDLDTMQLLRCAFDPARPVQPRQGVPDPAAVRRGAGAGTPAPGRGVGRAGAVLMTG